MPSGTEYSQACPVKQSTVRHVSGTEYNQQCPVGQSTVGHVQWDRVQSAMPSGTEYSQPCPVGHREYSQPCPVGQSTVSNAQWDRESTVSHAQWDRVLSQDSLSRTGGHQFIDNQQSSMWTTAVNSTSLMVVQQSRPTEASAPVTALTLSS